MFNTAAGKNSPTSTGGEMNFRLGSGFIMKRQEQKGLLLSDILKL